MVKVEIPKEYGYIVLVVAFAYVVNLWLALRVGRARKKYGVAYPKMYGDSAVFNCIQRSHQNFLEYLPMFLICLIFGGLAYPVYGAIAGVVFLLGRIVYAISYSTGDPEKRHWGSFQYLGFYFLLYGTIKFGVNLLGWF